MAEERKRTFSGASNATTSSEDLGRSFAFLKISPPPSTSSKYSSENLVRSSSMASKTPRDVLRRELSGKSVASTSSFAERMNRAHGSNADKKDYRIIGTGTCGTVFEIPGTEMALKKGTDVDAMWRDFLLTNRVHTAIADTRNMLQDAFPNHTLPRSFGCSHFFLPTSTSFWEPHLDRFPRSHRTRSAVFQMDRILPLPQPVREALIDLYFDENEEIQEEAKNDVDNKDCLIRIYLGEIETPKQASGCYDSLRNFPMRLNMIEDLKMDKFALATKMAIALAVIHWQAKIDGMDIEFVLGSAATTSFDSRRKFFTGSTLSEDLPPPTEVLWPVYFTERKTHCWVLDFDKASHIKLTANDVDKKLVPAFLGNDPYYPRPDVDEELWAEFSRAYLLASHLILDKNPDKGPAIMSLPTRFLNKVVEMIEINEDWNPEEHIVFGD